MSLTPRLTQTMTLGGARVSVMPGHISDKPIVLERTLADYQAVKEEVEANTDGSTDYALTTGQRLAVQIDSLGFVSKALLPLCYHTSASGYLIVELWDSILGVGGSPVKVAEVGRIQASNLHADSYQDIAVLGDISFPVGRVLSGETYWSYLVLNGDNFTGICRWRGKGSGWHFLYDAGEWQGIGFSGEPHYHLSKGSPLTILRGLCYAYGGGHEWEIDLDDGHLYRGIVVDVQGAFQIHPLTATGQGYVKDVKLTLMLTEQIG